MARQIGTQRTRASTQPASIEVKLSPNPVMVKMAKEEEEQTSSNKGWKVFFFIALVIIVFSTGWGAWQVLPRNVQSEQVTDANFPIRLTIDEPRNATLRDKLPVTVTVENTGSANLTLQLSMSLGSSDAAILSEDGLTSVEIKDLPPGGIYTHTFNFLPVSNQAIELQPTIRLWNGTTSLEKSIPDSQMKVVSWPPYLRLLLTYLLTTSGVAGALVGFGWERMKKVLGE